jgi:hypothetical protein
MWIANITLAQSSWLRDGFGRPRPSLPNLTGVSLIPGMTLPGLLRILIESPRKSRACATSRILKIDDAVCCPVLSLW